MDDIDRRLISILRTDGRASVSQIAVDLGVTRATVRARMARLEATGEILGYSVVVRTDAEEAPVRGVMLVEIEGKGTDQVVRALTGLPQVRAVHSTNGRWDLVVELALDSLAEVDAVLRLVRSLEGVANSETSLLLATRYSSRLRSPVAGS